MDLLIIKILVAIVLWLIILTFGLLPIKWTKLRANDKLIAYSNCFSGGLFIAIGLIHILPEAHFNLEANHESTSTKTEKEPFPLSYTICLLTFSFLLFIDKIVFNNSDISDPESEKPLKKSKSKKKADKIKESKKHKNDKFELEKWKKKQEKRFKRDVSSIMKIDLALKMENRLKFIHCDKSHEYLRGEKENSNTISDISCSEEIWNTEEKLLEDEENKPIIQKRLFAEEISRSDSDRVEVKNKEKKHHHHKVAVEKSYSKVYMILVAMGIHGIFSGLALGVTHDMTDLIYLTIAMLLHKWSEAFTVGVNFVKAKLPESRMIPMITLFSSFTPIGIFIGCWISNGNPVVTGVCFALSSGTFIYISCAEIIVEEFSVSTNKGIKFIFFMLGIGLVLAMGVFEADN